MARPTLVLGLSLGSAAALAAAAAGVSAASGPGAHAAATHAVTLKASRTQLRFSTSRISVGRGRVTVRMFNPSSTRHGIAVEGHGVDRDGRIVGRGGTSSVTVRLRPGSYVFYCPVPGHRAAGMRGRLVVR